jgi:hypothetical protein
MTTGTGRANVRGELKPIGMTPFDWACACRDAAEAEVARLRTLTEGDPRTIYWEAAQYRATLREIAGMDPVDNALDPQRAGRIAQSALDIVASEGTEPS